MEATSKFRDYAAKYADHKIKAKIVSVFIPSDEAWPQLLEIFGVKSFKELFPDYLAFKYQLRDICVRKGEYEKDTIDGVPIVEKKEYNWGKRIIVHYLDGILLDDFADDSIRKRLSDKDRGKISTYELTSGDRILKGFAYFPLILSNDLDKIINYLTKFQRFDEDYRRETATTLHFIKPTNDISMKYMFHTEEYHEYILQYPLSKKEQKGRSSSLGLKVFLPKDLRNFIHNLTSPRLEGYWAVLGYAESNEFGAPNHYFIDNPGDEHHWDIQDVLAEKFNELRPKTE